MFPSFNLFGKEIGMYAVCAIIGAFVSGLFCLNCAKKRNIDVDDTLIVLLFGALGAMIFSHLLYGITNLGSLFKYLSENGAPTSFKTVINLLTFTFGGSVFYGGLIGGLIVGTIAVKVKKMNLNAVSDIAAPTIPLFHIFGRIGCFFGGCCYGIPWEHGITFINSPNTAANGVARFPVSLFEAGINLLIFIFLMICLKKEFFKDKLIYIYLIIYPIARFFIEFLRDDEIRGHVLALSTSQWISIFLLLFSVASLVKIKISEKKNLM